MDELTSIINKLKESGEMSFYEGVSEEQIDNFEKEKGVVLPIRLREWYMFSDGGELFRPAGVQLYGVLHKPTLDLDDDDRPSTDFFVIGRLSDGEPILCKKNSEEICIYDHEADTIRANDKFADFFVFIEELPKILGINKI